MTQGTQKVRLDKWLWQARFFKTRGLANALLRSGRITVDDVPVSKPSRTISPGVTLRFTQARQPKVIEVLALADRRGPAAEAQALYLDHSPPPSPDLGSPRKGPRPTKRDRRKLMHSLNDPAPSDSRSR